MSCRRCSRSDYTGSGNAHCFLCAEFSIDGDMRHAGYILPWIGLLKHDCRAFFTARSKAQAAADYLRGLALRDQPAIAA